MNFKSRLLKRPSVDGEVSRDSVALPRFTFESDNRPLVSTERLFQQWQDEETQYQPDHMDIDPALRKEQDIIVRLNLMYSSPRAYAYRRSPGTDRTTQVTR